MDAPIRSHLLFISFQIFPPQLAPGSKSCLKSRKSRSGDPSAYSQFFSNTSSSSKYFDHTYIFSRIGKGVIYILQVFISNSSPLLYFDHSFTKMLLLGIAEEVTSYYNIFYSIHTHHSQLKSWFGVLRCPYVRFQHLLLNSYCKRYFKEFFQRIFCFRPIQG